MKQNIFIKATLAVAMAVFSSTAAMGQQQSDTKTDKTIDWMKEITSRVTFNGYAQGGYSYSDAGGKTTTDFNLKRTLLWAKARITDRWSFLFMHDFSSVVQEFYTDSDNSNIPTPWRTRCLPPCSNWLTSTHRLFSFLLVKDPTHCMVSITDETWD